jgi:3-methyl-2-oxobutanoate hydroxymethyltransferase
MLGMFSDYVPKFVKHFAEVGEIMKGAFADYAKEVKDGSFPAASQTYGIADDVLEKLY